MMMTSEQHGLIQRWAIEQWGRYIAGRMMQHLHPLTEEQAAWIICQHIEK